ncbi:MAG: oxidoreductase [Microbacterium sp. 69-10]|uniref:Gfo/Idh/MocA family protein n=1 Tax=Microbacterium sp. 69-10 TaxID=1895783 RepID=UPI000964158F|nr:Gfo/Idh/MocA family oxidoreductase [Microbacterium sp. 69-10]OJU40272.1 MAG: oxidoreductase [Microbacterium sp. 69-10]
MTALRWGLLAASGIATTFATALRAVDRQIVAVGSRTQDAADSFARRLDIPRAHASYEALVADPDVDIVYVSTPHPMHHANARLALEYGKHVLVEKAFTLTQAQAEDLRRLAAEKGLLVMEAMWTRYLPHMVRIRQIIAEGTLGEIRAVMADHTQSLPTDPAHRLNALELGGGALLDLGIYPISFIWDVLGEPTSIQASARLLPTGADAEVATVMRHAGGAISTSLSSSRAAGPNTATVIGTKARIDIDRVWYSPTSFRVIAADGTVIEEYKSDVKSNGMQYEALAAERLIAEGNLNGDLLPIAESVAIMGTLDEIRRQVGIVYPDVDDARPGGEAH